MPVRRRARVVVGGDQRLAAQIGAGRDERQIGRRVAPGAKIRRAGERVQDEPVQRRIGEHQADVAQARRDARRDRAPASDEHDRTGAAIEQRALDRTDLGQARGAGEIGDHHREGLGVARLAPAQARHRRLVAGVAEEVEAAEALERDDSALLQQRRDVRDRRAELRAAARTGDRLGVEAAVGRIGVVAGAVRAHRERRHRSLRAVVGQRARQRIARAAMGAVDQRIAEEAARRIEQLLEAGLADGGVGADAGRSSGPAASRR